MRSDLRSGKLTAQALPVHQEHIPSNQLAVGMAIQEAVNESFDALWIRMIPMPQSVEGTFPAGI